MKHWGMAIALWFTSSVAACVVSVTDSPDSPQHTLKAAAEAYGSQLPPGVYDVKVLDHGLAIFQRYRVTVTSQDGEGAAASVTSQQISDPADAKICQLLQQINAAEQHYRHAIMAGYDTTDDFPYRSAAEALTAKLDFAVQLQERLRISNELETLLRPLRAGVAQLTSQLSGSADIVLTGASPFDRTDVMLTRFPDGSSIPALFAFTTLDGQLQVKVTVPEHPAATDRSGQLIPQHQLSARLYVAEQENIDLEALARYFTTVLGSTVLGTTVLGARITTHKTGGSGAQCTPKSFACNSEGKQCELVYRCN